MTTAAPRSTPRRLTAAPVVRTSAQVASDIDASQNEAAAAHAEIARLSGETRAVLLSGDDEAHERHEAEIARLKRITARCAARQEELQAEATVADTSEADAAQEAERERAKAAVAAVLAKAAESYTKPAEAISAFVAEWAEADRLARAAGVRGPAFAIRHRPGERLPDTERTVEFYLDDQGNRTQNPHPYKGDGTLDRSRVRKLQFDVEVVPGDMTIVAKNLPDLPRLVHLPRLDDAGEHHFGDRADHRNSWR